VKREFERGLYYHHSANEFFGTLFTYWLHARSLDCDPDVISADDGGKNRGLGAIHSSN
jgi:hypothetical protein